MPTEILTFSIILVRLIKVNIFEVLFVFLLFSFKLLVNRFCSQGENIFKYKYICTNRCVLDMPGGS